MVILPVSPPFNTSDINVSPTPDFLFSSLNEPQDLFDTKWLEDMEHNKGEFIKDRIFT